MTALNVAVLALLEAPLADAHFELVDVDCAGIGTAAAALRVFVELAENHPIGGRIDLDGVAAATRIVDEILDADEDVIPGRYTLEVSSPGLERPVRTPAHFRRAIGSTITVKTVAGTPGERRIEGRLDDASIDSDEGIRIAGRVIAYTEIDKARLVVSWGPPPKPGKDAKAKRAPHPKAVAAAAALAAANVASGIVSAASADDAGADAEVDDDLDETEVDFEDSVDNLDDDDDDDDDDGDDLDDDGDDDDDDDDLDDDDEDDPAAPGTDEHEGDDV